MNKYGPEIKHDNANRPDVEPRLQEYEWTDVHQKPDVMVIITPVPEVEDNEEEKVYH